ncbi:hypothetical protein D3C71_1791380 [compost metagenome]
MSSLMRPKSSTFVLSHCTTGSESSSLCMRTTARLVTGSPATITPAACCDSVRLAPSRRSAWSQMTGRSTMNLPMSGTRSADSARLRLTPCSFSICFEQAYSHGSSSCMRAVSRSADAGPRVEKFTMPATFSRPQRLMM